MLFFSLEVANCHHLLSYSLPVLLNLFFSFSGPLANTLQEASVPIISDAVCNAPDYYDNQITTSMFCAGLEKGGIDACQVCVVE